MPTQFTEQTIQCLKDFVVSAYLSIGAVGLFLFMFLTQVLGQDLVPPLVDPRTPNLVALGAGTVPDYLGSDDYISGAIPIARYQPDGQNRYVFLSGNALGTNIIDHPWLRTGPTALYRFGRDDVKDEVVNRLPSIDGGLELGWSVGAEWIDPNNIARRMRVDTYASHDVSGTHDGMHIGLSVVGWLPVPDIALLGFYGAVLWSDTSYTDTYFSVTPAGSGASGLPAFEAGSGLRDGRLAITSMWPLGDRWVVGAGVSYMRLLGDAADSPITSDRGDPNQFLGGVGVGYTW